MSPTQQWPPPTPPPVVFSPPEPPPPPERKPAPRRAAEPSDRPLSDLTDEELAGALTRARSDKARLAAEVRRREGLPLGRTGPDRQPRKPYRDRGQIAAAVMDGTFRGEEVTVSGIMKSQQCGHMIAKQVIAALETSGVVKRDKDGRWYAK